MAVQQEKAVLVVGFGIAGALVCWFLHKHNIKYVVVDDAAPGSSSPVAAGLINPLAGRSLTLAHEVDRFLPFARLTYQQLGEFLGQELWADREFWTLLRNEQERKQWQARALDPGVHHYLVPGDLEQSAPGNARAEAGVARVRGGGQVFFSRLLQAFSEFLHRDGRYWRQSFDYAELRPDSAGSAQGISWTYHGQSWRAVLFCEGYRVRINPWFSNMPWRVNRGQRLLVEIPDLMPATEAVPAIWRKQALLAPAGIDLRTASATDLGPNLYWLGSVNDWDQDSPEPTSAAQAELLAMLRTMTDLPGQLVDIRAGIRPVLKDRRPVAGFHPQHPALGLLNGLGTKGALLGPWYASALVETLVEAQVNDQHRRPNGLHPADHPGSATDRSALLRSVSPARYML